jgi:hypothetical protein
MGFLDGFLGGVVSQRQRMEDQNRQDAQSSQQREDRVLQQMAISDDEETKALGIAGILASTQPKKKKGGFAGWLGEMQNNPFLDKARALIAHDQASGHLIPTAVAHAAGQHATAGDPATAAAVLVQGAQAPPETSAPAGSPAGVPATGPATAEPLAPSKPPTMAVEAPLPPTAGGAAMSGEKSLTEIGSAPPGPVIATPAAAPPVQPSPAAVLGQAARAPATVAPQPATVGSAPPALATAGGPPPSAILGQPTPPIGAGPLSPRGDVFRSPETQARKTKVATAQGDVEGLTAGLQAAGFSPEEIKAQLKLHYGRGTMGAGGLKYQSVAGEMPDPNDPTGKKMIRVNGAFDNAQGTYIGTDPDSPYYKIPIPGFISRQTSAQGQTPEQIRANTMARLEATNAAKLDAPIGVTNALRYGVPANTTMRQLQDQIPLSQQDQDKIHGISTLDGTLATVERLIPAVFPEEAPGIIGRIKTALSLFGQSAGRQPDITQLNAAIASTMAGIVRANGITQRLNIKELELAAQQMVNTSILHGDTLDSAQAKMVILRDLISRVQVGPLSQSVTPAKGATAGPSGPSAPKMVKVGNAWVLAGPDGKPLP